MLQEKIIAQRLLLEKMQAPQPPQPLPKRTVATNPPRHAPSRVRTRTIPIKKIFDQSEPEEEGYYRRGHLRRTPLSEELEEIQWPHRLNPAVLPQFDGESDPEEFLLKYEATIEAAGGGTACKMKALVIELRGLAQRWYANIPQGSILSGPTKSHPVTSITRSKEA